LTNSNFVWTAAINGSVDDNYFGVTLPFNVTLYTTTTNFVYVTTNGVSFPAKINENLSDIINIQYYRHISFYILNRFFVSEAVLLPTRKPLCLLRRFQAQQLYLIGMIYTFMRAPHKASIMRQKAVLQIVLLHSSFI
jgi:hypothetical protein